MYIVVSKWKLAPGSDPSQGAGRQMRDWIRQQDGVQSVHAIPTEDGGVMAMIAYRDEATYRGLIGGQDSPFEQKAKELQMEDFGEWQWSERGETVD